MYEIKDEYVISLSIKTWEQNHQMNLHANVRQNAPKGRR